MIWYSGAQRGVDFVGQVFTGRLRVDADALTQFIRESGDDSAASEMLSCAARALNSIGITGREAEAALDEVHITVNNHTNLTICCICILHCRIAVCNVCP